MARRHPDCVPVDVASLSEASELLLKNWMTKVIQGNGAAEVSINVEAMGPGVADPEGHAILGFDYQCDYRRFIHLEPVCKRLEKELPGASKQLLNTLDEVNYAACDILTPDALLYWAAHVNWYGEIEDEKVIEAYEDMNGEPLTDENRFDMPSDYLNSLGPLYKSIGIEKASGRRRRTNRFWSAKTSRALSAGKQAWVQQLLLLLQRVRRSAKALPERLAELAGEFPPNGRDHAWRSEPSFTLWWRGDDDMSNLYDQVVSDRLQGDSYQEEILRASLKAGSAPRFVTWIEAAARVLSDLDALYTLLGDQFDASKRKRQRVRK